MKLFQINKAKEFIQKETMYQTFGVNLSQRQIISFVGAGGKTTSMHYLAKELVSLGKRVIITTTTHMFLPTEYGVLNEDKNLVLKMLTTNGFAIVGTPCSDGKMTKVSDVFFEWIQRVSDYVLVEADGSKRLPIKVPNNNEPVLPIDTDLVIVVTGLSALFRPIEECCHRWELAIDLLSCQKSYRIRPVELAKLVLDGYCNKLRIPYRVYLNQCDSNETKDHAMEIMNYLNENHIAYENMSSGSFLQQV